MGSTVPENPGPPATSLHSLPDFDPGAVRNYDLQDPGAGAEGSRPQAQHPGAAAAAPSTSTL